MEPVTPDRPLPLNPVEHAPKIYRSPLLIPVIVCVILGVCVLIGYLVFRMRGQSVATYEECVKVQGSRIQESYPPACVTPDGKRFTEPLPAEEEQNTEPRS
jgi:hypothetical protein